MKSFILTASLSFIFVTSFAQRKVVKTFPCHDEHSRIFQQKLKTIDSLKKLGYVQTGLRVDYTFKQKGYNTQVLTFFKAN